MVKHKYVLEPYKGMNTRYRCPGCQHRDKTFSRYIDTETGEHIHPSVGRCNRADKCGYHYTPKQYFLDSGLNQEFRDKYARARAKCSVLAPQSKPVSYIPAEDFKKSLQIERDVTQVAKVNHFVKFLIALFGVEVGDLLQKRYFIGTSKHWNGATLFWQVDTKGKIRTGKIILYNPTTGKRVKNLSPPVYWAHKALKQPDFELKQCLFGEHLLIDKTKPVAIVESEKTAVIASIYLPEYIWLAVGSLSNLTVEKCSILRGRTVTLFPDLNAFDKWSCKAKELSHLASCQVFDLLERKATKEERKQGLDLADYLVRFDYREFAQPERINTPPKVQPLAEVKTFVQPEPVYYLHEVEQPKPENWAQHITEIENYFASITLPTQPIKLNKCSTITDCSRFIESHLATVKANNGKPTFLPYLNRLQELKDKMPVR